MESTTFNQKFNLINPLDLSHHSVNAFLIISNRLSLDGYVYLLIYILLNIKSRSPLELIDLIYYNLLVFYCSLPLSRMLGLPYGDSTICYFEYLLKRIFLMVRLIKCFLRVILPILIQILVLSNFQLIFFYIKQKY